LDWLLLQHAAAAGCQVDTGVAVRGALVDERGGRATVRGAVIAAGGHESRAAARITIAADGRHSTIAFGLGLAGHPPRPRRWAIGGYFEYFLPAAVDRSTLGEMHVRRGFYVGVAPIPGGLTNVCLVKPSFAGDAALGDPATLLTGTLANDPLLRDRAAGARLIAPPVILGPLAVDVREPAIDGLLLAGDAAGFIDPITGDGLRFAIHGAELAAASALRALAHGWSGVHADLTAERRRAFGGKWRFNRGLRALVSSPRAIDAAAIGARLAPAMLRAVIARAGDCPAA
jgi:flavin-dependent dehydrogenase